MRENAKRQRAVRSSASTNCGWRPGESALRRCAVSQCGADPAGIQDAQPKNRTGKLHRHALRESLPASFSFASRRAGCAPRVKLEHAQPVALRGREARNATGRAAAWRASNACARCFQKRDHDVASQVDHPAHADRGRADCRQPTSGHRAANWASERTGGFDVADRAAILVDHGVGAQIYECKVGETAATNWVFREPVATLIVGGGTIGHHYVGPTWELTDGEVVKGKQSAAAPAPHPVT
jgi:hypothetical protein